MTAARQRIGRPRKLTMAYRRQMWLEQIDEETRVTKIVFDNEPPPGATVTSYDERHFVTYIRLLDAEEEGADWREAASIIFGIDPVADAGRAKQAYNSHVARARWMTESGYRHLLKK